MACDIWGSDITTYENHCLLRFDDDSLADGYQRLEEASRLKQDAAASSRTIVPAYQTT